MRSLSRRSAELQTKIAAQQSDVSKAQQDLKQQQEQLRDALTALESAKKNVTTPQQIVREIPQYAPQLPQPITLNIPAPTKENPAPAPTSANLPLEDMKPLFDHLVDCQECARKLSAAENAAATKDGEIKDIAKERDEYKTALKGGTFWTRMKRNAKWFAIGAAAGAAVAYAKK